MTVAGYMNFTELVSSVHNRCCKESEIPAAKAKRSVVEIRVYGLLEPKKNR